MRLSNRLRNTYFSFEIEMDDKMDFCPLCGLDTTHNDVFEITGGDDSAYSCSKDGQCHFYVYSDGNTMDMNIPNDNWDWDSPISTYKKDSGIIYMEWVDRNNDTVYETSVEVESLSEAISAMFNETVKFKQSKVFL
jgi:hypothetical protein